MRYTIVPSIVRSRSASKSPIVYIIIAPLESRDLPFLIPQGLLRYSFQVYLVLKPPLPSSNRWHALLILRDELPSLFGFLIPTCTHVVSILLKVGLWILVEVVLLHILWYCKKFRVAGDSTRVFVIAPNNMFKLLLALYMYLIRRKR